MRNGWMVLGFLLLLSGEAVGKAPEVRIGSYYSDALNGLAFIAADQAAFVMRVGWIEDGQVLRGYEALVSHDWRPGLAAPDGRFAQVSWRAGQARATLEWGRQGPAAAVGRITVDRPARLSLELLPPWPTFKTFASTYRLSADGAGGTGKMSDGSAARWTLKTNAVPAFKLCLADDATTRSGELLVQGQSRDEGEGRWAALSFDVQPGRPLIFVAGLGELPKISSVALTLKKARTRYESRRAAASGEWGDFLAGVTAHVNQTRLYHPLTRRVAHVVSRGWCLPDGQMIFEWDSCFNALLASLEDPAGARETLRAMFANQQPSGFISNAASGTDAMPDRSQPPVASYCVWRIHQRWPDRAFLEEVYPKLLRWHDWWFSPRLDGGLPYRDGNRDGLLEWGSETGVLQNARFETGMDDSPMYDDVEMDPQSHTMRMDAVDLNALWAMDADYLARIAEELGKKADARRLRAEREAMGRRINKLLWNEELGLYCNRYWSPQTRAAVVGAAAFTHGAGQPGLEAEYYRGTNFGALELKRTDASIDFKGDEHNLPAALRQSGFSVRWQGKITPPVGGRYVFQVRTQGGVRLWIKGQKLIDEWQGHYINVSIGETPIQLEAGQPCAIRLEYSTPGAEPRIQLTWRGPATSKPEIFCTRLAPTCFYPMITGIPSQPQAQRMLKILTDPQQFWGEWVCPTISRADPAFPQQHYWRGKIWAPTNYLLYQGLKRYAPDDLRIDFARKSVALFMRNWLGKGTCNENYLASGEGTPDLHYLWGGLLGLIGVEEICGTGFEGKKPTHAALREKIRLRNIPLRGRLRDYGAGQ